MRRPAALLALLLASTALAADAPTDGNDAPPDAAIAPARPDDVPPEAVLADLPFLDDEEAHRIFVDLAPEGYARPLRFLVATGASHNVATPRAANDLGIRVRRLKRDPYRRSTVLGRDVQVHVDTRASDTASKTGWEYAMLGGDFLGRYVIELDFQRERMRFIDPRRFELPERTDADDEAVLPLTVRMNRPGVEILVNGRPRLVVIETAVPLPAVLSGEVAAEARVPASGGPTLHVGSVLGPVRGQRGSVAELALGPFVLRDVPVLVSPHGWYNQGMPGDSTIGYELLQQFLVRIDYERRRLWLKRNPDAPARIEGRAFETGLDRASPEPGPGS